MVAPKTMGRTLSAESSTVSASATVPSASAASSASSGGTPDNTVSVVSSGEAVPSTESATGISLIVYYYIPNSLC